MASSGTASAVGDLLAQTIVGNTYDPRRTLVFAAIGVFYFAPLLHLWYKALHKLEKSGVSSGNFTRRQIIGLQLLMNQSIGAMCANGGFFYAYAAFDRWLPGGANAPILETASRAFHRKFWRIMKANWVVWPLPSFVNLALVPLDYRVLFMNCFAVVWKCVLSLLTRAGA
jgi:protein Mpv17